MPHRDPQAVAEALARLVDDPALRRRLGDGLRRIVEQRYSTQVVVQQWRDLLDEVLTEPAGRAPAGRAG